MKNKSTGFTLIELVVVIVILGILMAVAIPKYIDITERAKIAADKGQLGALRAATHMLYASNALAGATYAVTNGAVTNQVYWPLASNVWAHLQSTNAWQYYTTVTYLQQSNGIWVTTPAE